MKFFTVYEILNSIIISALSGIAFGVIYCASESIFVFIKEMIFVLPNSVRILPSLKRHNIVSTIKCKPTVKLNKIEKNIFEAVMFLLFGMGCILISYIALDGFIRIYIFLLTALFFIISFKYIGKKILFVFERIFGEIYFITVIMMCTFLFPLYKLGIKMIVIIRKIMIIMR